MNQTCKTTLLVISVLVVGLGAGVLIGYLATRNSGQSSGGDGVNSKKTPQLANLDMDLDIRAFINDEIKAENIRSHSKLVIS